MTFALQLLLASAEEGVPLWNPLSIATLVLAGVGTLGTVVLGAIGAMHSYRRDHPAVKWRLEWTGPYHTSVTGVEMVTVWISNRGNGIAHDVDVKLGSDGQIRSGENRGDVAFGDGFRFEFRRAQELGLTTDFFGYEFRTQLLLRLTWSQEPNLHRRISKSFVLPIAAGQKGRVASGPLPRRVLNDPGIY